MSNERDFTFKGLVIAAAQGKLAEEWKRRRAVYASVYERVDQVKEKSERVYGLMEVTRDDAFAVLSQEDKNLIIAEFQSAFDDLLSYFEKFEREKNNLPLQGFEKLQEPVNILLTRARIRLIELGVVFE